MHTEGASNGSRVIETRNARPRLGQSGGAGATKGEGYMPRTGRPPRPPSHNDALSEALVELFAEFGAHQLARKRYEQAQRAREHTIAALLRDAWNHHAAAYSPEREAAA